jgi:hypothetical protein
VAGKSAAQPQSVATDDLVALLVRAGARVVARPEHGIFLEVLRRLVFLRRGPLVERSALVDALRAAEIGPGRFDRLLAEVRSDREPPASAPSAALREPCAG